MSFINLLPSFGKFSAIISLNNFFVPFFLSSPSGRPIMRSFLFVWFGFWGFFWFFFFLSFFGILWFTQAFLTLFHFFSLFFFECYRMTCLWLHRFSSALSNMLLMLSIAFFNSFIVFFSSRISVWFFLWFLYLLNSLFCLCIVFLISLNYLSVCVWLSL